ncbi:uncharacterized protein PRCAT00003316001 [Priceomyces carsonii]|uniref:uncharacterized protein n=1 Tax=Priceomyces carsonii TaxID=28549 RepID=UPI002ED9061B|nr:unnamed protein product [Priceomyces carsonii]
MSSEGEASLEASPSKNIKNLSINVDSEKNPVSSSSTTDNVTNLTNDNHNESDNYYGGVSDGAKTSEDLKGNNISSSSLFKVPKKVPVTEGNDPRLSPAAFSNNKAEQKSASSGPIGTGPTSVMNNHNNTNNADNVNNADNASNGNNADNTNNTNNNNNTATPMLNKSIISNLNKSLKAKQRIINTKEPHPKNPTLISEIMNTSPQSSAFPNNLSTNVDAELENKSPSNINNPASSQQNAPGLSQESSIKPSKGKSKKIAKQNSTRTDFFAAKLASAVDDVESSDSDETFVYENNLNDFDNINSGEPANLASRADSVSLNGSVNINGISSLNSPATEVNDVSGKVDEAPSGQQAYNQPDSLHSIHSTKIPTLKPSGTVTPQLTVKPSNSSINNSLVSTNLLEASKRPQNQRSASSSSAPYFSKNDSNSRVTTQALEKVNPPSPSGPFSESGVHSRNSSSQGLGLLDNRSYGHTNNLFHATNSVSGGYNDDHYSYDEVDDEMVDDDISTDGDFYSTQRNIGSSNTTVPLHEINASNKLHHIPSIEQRVSSNIPSLVTQNGSVTSKGTSKKHYKSSNASSKLRSTTSKLFDRKGSQPRRYSIIPDDIDIEDFDDDLIYYDKNIRFPYNSNSSFNESSPLINQGHKLPHYRSLNLQGHHRLPSNLKSKRYLSTGQALLGSKSGTESNNHDIFPFPHPDAHQKYYYDIDEYDENQDRLSNENKLEPNNSRLSGQYNKTPRLSPNTNHFRLPRKSSNDLPNRINCIKSFIYTLISIMLILSIGFVMGFILASTKDLANVSIVDIEKSIVSQDELIFDIVVEAYNPGWFAVTIEQVELDIFAKSGYLPDSPEAWSEANTVETVLLGTVLKLETSMDFEGGFFNRDPISQVGEIRLLSPGRNLTNFMDANDGNSTEPDNSKKWEIISKNPFDLIVRGILKYNLPLSKNAKSVVVNKVGYINPSSPDTIYSD